MDDLAQFWQGRFAAQGHTGWFDKKIYAFDQECRLQRLSEWLERSLMPPGKALDFGCGSGDFSRLLIGRGWQVVAYDHYVAPTYSHARLKPTRSLSEIVENGPYDLIVSITVLDHILDDVEFTARLTDLRTCLRPNGRFFFLEYAGDIRKPRSSYQTFRLLSEWKAAFDKAGLCLTEVHPYFHPEEAPIPAWHSYRGTFLVKALGGLGRLGISQVSYGWLLRRLVHQCLISHPYVIPVKSPIKIMIGQAAGNAIHT